MNWIQISGNFIKVEGNTLRYVPAADLSSFTHSTDSNKHLEFTGIIQSSAFFENGSVNCKLNLTDPDSFFTIQFSNRNLIFSLNSGLTNKAFAVRRLDGGENINLIQNVDRNSIIANHDYSIEIHVDGSNLRLFVDGVLIGTTYVQVNRSQIVCSFRSKGQILLKDFSIKAKKPKIFVVMQFSEDYNQLYKQVIKPVCEEFGYECLRGDEYFTTGSILKDIIDAINESAIVIADITPNNPNVFYEVGYSHASSKPTILLSDKKRDKLPFDVSGFRTLFYDNTIAGKSEVEDRLRKHLENIQTGN